MATSNFLKRLRKKTGSSSFKDSKFVEPNHYIDTGSMSLNRIISGDVNKGIPGGRVIILAGETGTLKTVQAIRIAVNALNQNDYDQILYFDSEGGAPREMVENMGGDPSKIEHIVIENIEDANVKILGTYTELVEEKEKNPDFKALLIMDSIGALVGEKVMRDVEKGKLASDMGGSAKLIGTLVRSCTIPALKSDASIIFINHVYLDPSAMYASKIQNQSGGLRLQYMSTITLQCAKKLEKPGDKKTEEAFYSGSTMKFFTVKNRLCRQFIETEVFVDFKKGFGPKKYMGLIDPAIQYGIITNEKQGYLQIPSLGDKQYRRKQLEDGKIADEIWKQILPVFNEKSKEDLKYSSINNKIDIEEIIKED